MEDTILSIRNITKTYPGVVAIDNFSLDLKRGEIHALIGENGAGKSTMIKCLSGAIIPDSGEIIFEGKSFSHLTPKTSRELGIEVIYQEINLVDGLSVGENICLGEDNGRWVNFKAIYEKASETFKRMNVKMDVKVLVQELSIAQQQLVEIAKALSKNVKLLILDEPTAPLSTDEVTKLFEIMKSLKEQGVTMIYISHRLDEVFQITDRVTVMRDGKFIQTLETGKTERKELIRLMVGRELSETYPVRSNITEEPALEVCDFSGEYPRNINLKINKGEIVGLAGLVGAGRTELARAIFGADPSIGGKVLINGEEVKIKNPRDAIKKRIGLIPEDRKNQGCFLFYGIDWNISIANMPNMTRKGFIDHKGIKKAAEHYHKLLNIKTPTLSQLVVNLSGGNQQKVVLAKTLATDSDIIIFDEPTRGIDVGAKHEIYELMTSLADQGKAILMISSDMEELLGMSDRIYVLCEGRITGELKKDEFSQVRILELASSEN